MPALFTGLALIPLIEAFPLSSPLSQEKGLPSNSLCFRILFKAKDQKIPEGQYGNLNPSLVSHVMILIMCIHVKLCILMLFYLPCKIQLLVRQSTKNSGLSSASSLV